MRDKQTLKKSKKAQGKKTEATEIELKEADIIDAQEIQVMEFDMNFLLEALRTTPNITLIPACLDE